MWKNRRHLGWDSVLQEMLELVQPQIMRVIFNSTWKSFHALCSKYGPSHPDYKNSASHKGRWDSSLFPSRPFLSLSLSPTNMSFLLYFVSIMTLRCLASPTWLYFRKRCKWLHTSDFHMILQLMTSWGL